MIHSFINYAYIETTNYCNLKCVGCNRESVVKNLKHMSVLDFNVLLAKINDQPIHEAKLMGMGEPYLHPHFSEICSSFRNTFPKSYIISSTNCQYKLGFNFSESLKYLDMVYLSIDGIGLTYEKLRPPGIWSNIIKFLDDLSSIKRYNCKLPVNFTIFKSNMYEIPEILKIIDFYNLDELRLNIAQDWNESTNSVNDYSEKEIEYLKQFKRFIKGKSIWEYKDCFWPKSGLYITTEGNVKVCCMNTGGLSHGNIFKESLESIRNKNSFVDIKNGCMANIPTDHCVNCSYNTVKNVLDKIFK